MRRKQKNKISRYILNFCKTISQEQPILVPLHPVVSEPINECFSVVPDHIIHNGGTQIIGWSIHVWHKVMIEAEFHCIWKSPDGKLIDISPKMYKADSIIFLPDPEKQYTGLQIDNIRKPLTLDKAINQYISLMEEYIKDINKGDLANQYGAIDVGNEVMKKQKALAELELLIAGKYGNKRGISIGGKFIKYQMKF